MDNTANVLYLVTFARNSEFDYGLIVTSCILTSTFVCHRDIWMRAVHARVLRVPRRPTALWEALWDTQEVRLHFASCTRMNGILNAGQPRSDDELLGDMLSEGWDVWYAM